MSPLKLALVLEAVNRISEPVRQAEKSVGGFRQEVDKTAKAAEKLKALSASCEKVGRDTAMMGAAAGTGAGVILRAFTELEDAQAAAKNAYSTLDGLDKAWESINRQAVRAGDLFPGTTADFINLATAMKKMGMDAATIESGAFQGAAALQVMFGLNPVQAGEQFVTMGRALGVAGKDSIVFADTIQRVSNAAGLGLGEIADAMPYAGAALKRFGVGGIQDAKMVLATMGLLKQAGLNGSMIGTSLAGAMDHLAELGPKLARTRGAIAAEAAAAMRRSGVDLQFFDQAGKFKGYGNFLAQLDKLKAVKSDADRALIGKTFFGEEGGRLASLVTLQGYEDMARKMVQQENIQVRLDRITKTLGNSYEAAGGTAKNVAAAFGEKMAPALKMVLDRVNTFLSGMGVWIDRHPILSRNIGLSLVSLAALLTVVGGGALVIAKLSTGLLGAGQAAWTMTRGVYAGGRAVWDTGQAIYSCTKYAGGLRAGLAAWSRLQFPGIVKLGGHLMDAWRGMIRLGPALWANVTAAWAWTKAWIASPVESIKDLGNLAWGSMMKLLPAMWANVTAAWAWTAALLANPITWIVAGVLALGAAAYLVIKHWDKVKAWFVGLWAWFKKVLGRTPDWVLALIAPVALIIKHWDKIKVAFSALWGWIKGMGSKFKEAGLNIVKAIWEGIKGMASKPVEAIKAIVQKLRRFLPFSPAKEGPLQDIHRIRLVETIAGAIRPEPLVAAMRGALGAAMAVSRMTMAPMAVGAFHAPAAASAGPAVVIHFEPRITVQGGAAADVEKQVRAALKDCRDDLLRQVTLAMESKERRRF